MKSFFAFSRKHTILLVILIILIGFVVAAYFFNLSWTGFPTSIGPSLPPTDQYRPAKTVWDWLAAFAFPVVVGLEVAWYTTKFNEQQSRTAYEIALDNQREAALQAYLDRVPELLLRTNLSEARPNEKGVSGFYCVRSSSNVISATRKCFVTITDTVLMSRFPQRW